MSGGTPTSIPVEPGMKTITASSGNLLIASLPDGHLAADTSLTGAWTRLGRGRRPGLPRLSQVSAETTENPVKKTALSFRYVTFYHQRPS